MGFGFSIIHPDLLPPHLPKSNFSKGEEEMIVVVFYVNIFSLVLGLNLFFAMASIFCIGVFVCIYFNLIGADFQGIFFFSIKVE